MIRLRVLGPIELEDSAGRELRSVLAQPKRLALLAYLATATRGFHRRDTLLALFWPELDDAHARPALNQAIRFLRKELGAASATEVVISRGADELGINPASLWCDACAFGDELRAGRHADALALYRGDFLKGFFAGGSAELDEWLDRERAEFRANAARAARTLAEERETEEHFSTAVSSARRAVELSDGDERVVRELLELLDRLGDRAGAIRAYEAFASRLASELEATPSPETVALIGRIRAHAATESRSANAARIAPPDTIARSRPPLATSSESIAAGTHLDRWRVERELARGGMAIVYLARDIRHNRQVALKVIRPELLLADGANRFIREIEITASFAHPHILPLIDSGASDGLLYLVTPYIGGESLRARLRRERRLPVADAVRISAEIAEALDYAHRRGIVHRDITPENVLLADGHALVSDFGVARALSSSGVVTKSEDADPGAIVGSRGYRSPEQAVGDSDAGVRSDIYSLGCVMYEMLTGELPRGDESPLVIDRARQDTPSAIAGLVSACLAREPDRRPGSASIVLRILDGANGNDGLAGVVTDAETVAQPAVTSATPPRRTRNLWAASVAAVLVLGGSVVLLVDGPPPETQTPGVALPPFQNMTGDATLDHVGRAISSSIATGLAELGTVAVIPNGQSNADVAFTVTGSYYRRGDSLEFLTEIWDRRRNRVLPPPVAQRAPAGDPLAASGALQDGAVGALAFYTSIFGVDSTPQRRPPSYEAYVAFTDGHNETVRFDWPAAEEGFRRAIALDPQFTEAYLMLGTIFMNQPGKVRERGGQLGRFEAIDSLARTMRQAITPLTDADRFVIQHFSAYADGKIDNTVEASIRMAEHLPAANFETGFFSVLANRPRTAVGWLKRVDPERGGMREWSPYFVHKTAALHQLGDYRGELRAAQRGRERFPNAAPLLDAELRARSARGKFDGASTDGLSPNAALRLALEMRAHGDTAQSNTHLAAVADLAGIDTLSTAGRVRVSMALLALDRLDEAAALLESSISRDPRALDLKGMLATTYARQGKRREALQISEELLAVREDLHGLQSLWRARIAARLGERENAVKLLGQAFSEGTMHHPAYPAHRGSFWHTDPDFESMRDYRLYQDLIRPR